MAQCLQKGRDIRGTGPWFTTAARGRFGLKTKPIRPRLHGLANVAAGSRDARTRSGGERFTNTPP